MIDDYKKAKIIESEVKLPYGLEKIGYSVFGGGEYISLFIPETVTSMDTTNIFVEHFGNNRPIIVHKDSYVAKVLRDKILHTNSRYGAIIHYEIIEI